MMMCVVAIGNQIQIECFVKKHILLVCGRNGVKVVYKHNGQFISYFGNLPAHKQSDHLSNKNHLSRRLLSGVQASYTPVHSYNILVITHVLGFISDLGDN